jgi:SPP1 family predicted phage head-tail adaptor
MKIAALNRRVTIQQLTEGQDEIGQPVQAWTPLAEVWANVRTLNGLETIKADAEVSISKASIRIRRRTDVTAAMRVLLGSTVYQVKAVLQDEASRKWTDLACEVVA